MLLVLCICNVGIAVLFIIMLEGGIVRSESIYGGNGGGKTTSRFEN